MVLDYQKVDHIFIICGKTDLRKGINGLAAIIQHKYNLDVYDDDLFLFCSGRRDRFKMLYYEKDGFLLLYKRLDQGQLRWPRSKKEIRCLTYQQIRWLLEGLSVDQLKTISVGKRGIFITKKKLSQNVVHSDPDEFWVCFLWKLSVTSYKEKKNLT